jgi:hypothetical protein
MLPGVELVETVPRPYKKQTFAIHITGIDTAAKRPEDNGRRRRSVHIHYPVGEDDKKEQRDQKGDQYIYFSLTHELLL